ncbi:MAG: ERF family protein [Sporolactobacillus sp.]
MAEKSSLGIKICEIMEQVQYIKKNGVNNFNHYTYATEADVQDAVRKEMAKRHVFMFPDVVHREIREHENRKGNREYIGTVDIKFTFTDADSGESIAFTMVGEGEDALDKAFYKAITGTQKYALMKLFMIPTGDDPEKDNKTDDTEQNAEQKKREAQKVDDVQTAKINNLIAEFGQLANQRTDVVVNAIKSQMKIKVDLKEVNAAVGDAIIVCLEKWIEGRKSA